MTPGCHSSWGWEDQGRDQGEPTPVATWLILLDWIIFIWSHSKCLTPFTPTLGILVILSENWQIIEKVQDG